MRLCNKEWANGSAVLVDRNSDHFPITERVTWWRWWWSSCSRKGKGALRNCTHLVQRLCRARVARHFGHERLSAYGLRWGCFAQYHCFWFSLPAHKQEIWAAEMRLPRKILTNSQARFSRSFARSSALLLEVCKQWHSHWLFWVEYGKYVWDACKSRDNFSLFDLVLLSCLRRMIRSNHIVTWQVV